MGEDVRREQRDPLVISPVVPPYKKTRLRVPSLTSTTITDYFVKTPKITEEQRMEQTSQLVGEEVYAEFEEDEWFEEQTDAFGDVQFGKDVNGRLVTSHIPPNFVHSVLARSLKLRHS